ncbi:signal peptidase I [Candidatus Daviesbacteria bacterium]|nr:signal peptidase I [Candidatus Daviesbacteria bacterium]
MGEKKLVIIIVGALIIGAILLVTLVFHKEYTDYAHFQITGAAMAPNFVEGQSYRVDTNIYKTGSPQRGDVVAFKDVKDPSKTFAKRIVGLPGEKIMLKQGKIYINGKVLEESYLQAGTISNPGEFLPADKEVTIPQENYFIMGDNRDYSSDSRIWGFLPRENIVGKLTDCYQNCSPSK